MSYETIMGDLNTEFWGNTIKAYLISIGMIICSVIVAWIVKRVSKTWLRKMATKTKTKVDDIFLELVDGPLYSLLIVIGSYNGLIMLNFSERTGVMLHHAMILASSFVIVMTAIRLVKILFDTYVSKYAEKTESRLDDQIIPVMRRALKIVVVILAVLLVLDNFGFDVMALITGLGLGGLALAMAAKDTLSNVLGGVTIFIDQPFQIGDVIDLKGTVGKVEEVGLRTTRVRTFTGHLVTVPNSAAATSIIENISARPSIRVRFNIGLEYSTTLEKCRESVDLVVDAVGKIEGVLEDPGMYFVEFGESTLDFQLTYYIDTSASFFGVKHAVNLAIKEALGEAGISMAFPTVTIDAPEDMFKASAS